MIIRIGATLPNKSLQVTFDSPRTFTVAKARVASNAPELRRYIRDSYKTASGRFLPLPSQCVLGWQKRCWLAVEHDSELI